MLKNRKFEIGDLENSFLIGIINRLIFKFRFWIQYSWPESLKPRKHPKIEKYSPVFFPGLFPNSQYHAQINFDHMLRLIYWLSIDARTDKKNEWKKIVLMVFYFLEQRNKYKITQKCGSHRFLRWPPKPKIFNRFFRRTKMGVFVKSPGGEHP